MDCMYVYSWTADETQERTQIRAYGIDTHGKTTVLIIPDFTPYVYIELPNSSDWQNIKQELDTHLSNKVLFTKVVTKNHLYKNKGKGKFLYCQCSSRKYINNISFMLKQQTYRGHKLILHEELATSVLQLTSLKRVPMATWMTFNGKDIDEDERQTSCDREIYVSWKNIGPGELKTAVFPKILAFDLEVNSEVMNAMPSNKPKDEIFQISCVLEHHNVKTKILLTLDGVDLTDNPLLQDIVVKTFEKEEDLLMGFINLIKDIKPNVLAGYNILMFDISYLIKRCDRYNMTADLQLAGFNQLFPAHLRSIKWSSSAFKNQEYTFIDWEGILLLDLLPIIKRDYKFENYKLDTVSSILIGAEKDPVNYKEIFKAYRTKNFARVGKYCVQDSNLCIDLLNHIHCWISFAEMAAVCKVSMFALYTQGQQVKIYNQVYDYCLRENIVVTSNGYECKSGERYLGAYVMDPIPGYYKNVCPLDFASLYPSIIIAHNICYSTFISETDARLISSDQYETLEWEDHLGCEHDPNIIEIAKLTTEINKIDKIITAKIILRNAANKNDKKIIQAQINELREEQRPIRKKRMELKKTNHSKKDCDETDTVTGIICAKRKYRFLKKEVYPGVIPTIIRRLLDMRKQVKANMKTCCPEEKLVLDKKQLAYKVSANSQYGAMGVRRGMLPFMPGAMCVTYLGRQAILKAGDIVCKKYRGEWIYSDTDSTYVNFPHLSSLQEIWDYAIDVAKLVSSEFPDDMNIEFEQAIYTKFIILSKKRYIYYSTDRNGNSDGKIGKRGVVLARRDNSKLLRNFYSGVIEMTFDGITKQNIELYLIERISDMFRRMTSFDQYIATKSIRSTDDDGNDADTKDRAYLGDYKIKPLPTNVHEREQVLNGRTERQYYIDSCPAQVQLSERMRLRGFPVDVGSRMEYVVLDKPNKKTLGGKIEDADYFLRRKKWLKLDNLYYLKSLVNPLDQLLSVALDCNNFIENQLIYRTNYSKLIKELTDLFRPRVRRDPKKNSS